MTAHVCRIAYFALFWGLSINAISAEIALDTSRSEEDEETFSLRGAMSHEVHSRRLPPGGCYDCSSNNPCTSVMTNGVNFYFEHCDYKKFIQCSLTPGQCFEMQCPEGTKWVQDYHACDIIENTSPSVDNKNAGNTNQIPGAEVSSCNGNTRNGGQPCGSKPCYDHTAEPWGPLDYWNHDSRCDTNQDCESCCCATYAGGFKICTNSVDEGPGLDKMCPWDD